MNYSNIRILREHWRRLKVFAAKNELTLGDALNLALDLAERYQDLQKESK